MRWNVKKNITFPLAVLALTGIASVCRAEPSLEHRTTVQVGSSLIGTPCVVDYEVSWVGARDACVVLPLQVTQPDWGRAELTATRTMQEGDRWKVVQSVAYLADRAGKHTIPAAEVGVILENQPIVGRFDATPARRLKMDAVEISATAPISPGKMWGVSTGVAFAVCVGAAVFAFRRRKAVSVPGGADTALAVRDMLHTARRHRLDGDLYACYQTLFRAAETLQSEHIEAKSVADTLRLRTPAVGFQGVRPNDDEIEGHFRDLERILARCSSAPVAQQETSS